MSFRALGAASFFLFTLQWNFVFAEKYQSAESCWQYLDLNHTSPEEIKAKLDQITKEQRIVLEMTREKYRSGGKELLESLLQNYVDEGARKYLKDEDFIFKDSLKEIPQASGMIRDKILSAHYKSRNYIIKKYKPTQYPVPELRLLEILNAKFMEHLGLGPKTDLVFLKGSYYLVMYQVPGINIKDVLFTFSRPSYTKKTLDQMMGQKTKSVEESVAVFAKLVLASKTLRKRLYKIFKTLDNYKFTSLNDFQFMIYIDPTDDSQNQINIIDTVGFRRFEPPVPFEKRSASEIKYEHLMFNLESAAEYIGK